MYVLKSYWNWKPYHNIMKTYLNTRQPNNALRSVCRYPSIGHRLKGNRSYNSLYNCSWFIHGYISLHVTQMLHTNYFINRNLIGSSEWAKCLMSKGKSHCERSTLWVYIFSQICYQNSFILFKEILQNIL